MTRLRAKRPGPDVRFLAGTDIFPFTAFRPTSGFTSFGFSPLSSNVRWPGPYHAKLGMRGSLFLSLHTPSWLGA